MPVHGLFVESVDLRGLGGSSGGNDFLSDSLDRCPVPPGEKKLGPLARKGACDSAADRASGSVDHCNLVLQHHLWSPCRFGLSPRITSARGVRIRGQGTNLGQRPLVSKIHFPARRGTEFSEAKARI